MEVGGEFEVESGSGSGSGSGRSWDGGSDDGSGNVSGSRSKRNTAPAEESFRRLNETFYVGSCGFGFVSLI